MRIKTKKDVKEFMTKLKNGEYFCKSVIHERVFLYHDKNLCINGGSTEITYHPSDGWSYYSRGQGWEDQGREYKSTIEMENFIWDNKSKINKAMKG